MWVSTVHGEYERYSNQSKFGSFFISFILRYFDMVAPSVERTALQEPCIKYTIHVHKQ